MASAEDITGDLETLAPRVKQKYLPQSTNQLPHIRTQLVKLSDILESIIRTFYRSNAPNPTSVDVKKREDEIPLIKSQIDSQQGEEFLSSITIFQTQLFYE